MVFQHAGAAESGEVIFRSVKSGITVTDTLAALQEGEPAILATSTAGGVLGQVAIRALTVSSVVNRIVLGAVRGTIPHEAMGLVQVYGVGPVRLAEAASVAVGDKLIPDLNTTATALAPYGRGSWIARTITDADLHFAGGASVIVVTPTTALTGTSTATPYTNANAFIRAL
jgi:hypothetical protein